jgi:hypothetical protein
MPRAKVRERCGRPDDFGTQPRVLDWRRFSHCSAPLDVYSDRMVLYDCHGSIADIGDVRVHGFVRKWEDDFVLDVRSPAR